MSGPLDLLGVLARQEVAVSPTLRHLEFFTMEGLLTVLAHGPDDAETAVILCGGAMGGLLGPADGLYHDLGESFAEQGIATLRLSYRSPNDLAKCVLDTCATAQLAGQGGAKRFVVVGHSFGGAVAINAALSLPKFVVAVVGLSTQSAGCERVGELAPAPLLLLHGDRDSILPVEASVAVVELSGHHAQLEVLEGADHLLVEAGEHLRERLGTWIPEQLATA